MTRRLQTPKRGEQFSAKQMARMARYVERHDKPQSFSGIYTGFEVHQSSSGEGMMNNAYQPFWAKITAKDTSDPIQYSFKEMHDATTEGVMEDDGASPRVADHTDAESYPAYEVNERDTPINEVVLMWLASSSDHYLFWYPGPEVPCLKFSETTSLLICGDGKSYADIPCLKFSEYTSLLICNPPCCQLCVVFDAETVFCATKKDQLVPDDVGPEFYFTAGALQAYAGFGCLTQNNTGTTTDVFVTVRDTGYICSHISITVKNTGGANSLTYEITAYDYWNNTTTATGTVAFGALANIFPDNVTYTSIGRPIIRTILKVKSTAAGLSTTYDTTTVFNDLG
jgi:hypothetical protein